MTAIRNGLAAGTILVLFLAAALPIVDAATPPSSQPDGTSARSRPENMAARYATSQPHLFQPIPDDAPTRLPGGSAYSWKINGLWGPTATYVNCFSGWAWDHTFGDWLDAKLTRQGDAPWFQVAANAASGSGVPHKYTVDVTSVLQYVQVHDRWCAFMLKAGGAQRPIAGTHQTTYPAPVINVTYNDASTAKLPCWVISYLTTRSAYPQQLDANQELPAVIEFDRPARPVRSATMTFTVTSHPSGGTLKTINGFLIDPTVNSAPVRQGLAARHGNLDKGITDDVQVFGAHRYLDGTRLADFVQSTGNPYNDSPVERNFDPALWGGASDKSKYPWRGLGKWVLGGYSSGWSLVPSSYKGEGFAPLAPGFGAIRVNMPPMAGITDGSVVAYYGTCAANAFIFLPESDFGLLRRMFVRYYIRIGTPYDSPFKERYQVYHSAGNKPIWTDMGGKTGICPNHVTSYGGVTGSSGGGYGWQMRLSWSDCDAGLGGPYEHGWCCGLHTFDFGAHNPKGYRYMGSDSPKDCRFGHGGGSGGVFYAGQWYEIEMEVNLNSVSNQSPGFAPDGEIRVWIDGRLMFERTGMVVRSLPIYTPAYKGDELRPCRELGHAGLWFNWFHGGVTQNSIDRTMFVTGLVWAKDYIGPMKGI